MIKKRIMDLTQKSSIQTLIDSSINRLNMKRHILLVSIRYSHIRLEIYLYL